MIYYHTHIYQHLDAGGYFRGILIITTRFDTRAALSVCWDDGK